MSMSSTTVVNNHSSNKRSKGSKAAKSCKRSLTTVATGRRSDAVVGNTSTAPSDSEAKELEVDRTQTVPSTIMITDNCHRVLRFITQLDREGYSTVFHDISESEYRYILHTIQESSERPRLAYDSDTLELAVDMPSFIHENVVALIHRGLDHVGCVLQSLVPAHILSACSYMNTMIKGGRMEITPDFTHIVTTRLIPPTRHILVIGEVAFSQSEADLDQRLRNIAKAFPKVVMIFVVMIDETQPYCQPNDQSSAWRTLGSEEAVRSQADFLSDCMLLQSLTEAIVPPKIMVAGHCWCSISNVRIKVWLKGDGMVNIDKQDSSLIATGDSFPEKSLAHVTEIFEKGLSLMRDKYSDLTLSINPAADVTALLAKHISLPFVWDDILSSLALESMSYAYDRYTTWYKKMSDEGSSYTPGHDW